MVIFFSRNLDEPKLLNRLLQSFHEVEHCSIQMDQEYHELQPSDDEEFKVLSSVLNAHCMYGSWAIRSIVLPKRRKYLSLSDAEKSLLNWFPDYLAQLEHSIEINSNFFTQVAETMGSNWGGGKKEHWFPPSENDLDKVRGLMIQYVREWSSDGADEREKSMGRILRMAEKLFPDVIERPDVHVLVPGAGLGRLVVEFVKRGFRTQGNEISYHMLLNCNYLLSNTYCENNFVISPFIHKSSNVEKRNYQCRQIHFPDFNPGDISLLNIQYPEIDVQELMSMVAGGFVDLYGPPDRKEFSDIYTSDSIASEFRTSNKGKFKIIATSFFIDTATNIIEYLETIKYCLHDDGYWINFGPLLWHFENDSTEIDVLNLQNKSDQYAQKIPLQGLELSKEDLLDLISKVGFEFLEHESNIETSYGGDPRALGSWIYKCEFWVCKKI